MMKWCRWWNIYAPKLAINYSFLDNSMGAFTQPGAIWVLSPTSFVALRALVRDKTPNTIHTYIHTYIHIYIHDLTRISIDCLTPASRLRRSASVWISTYPVIYRKLTTDASFGHREHTCDIETPIVSSSLEVILRKQLVMTDTVGESTCKTRCIDANLIRDSYCSFCEHLIVFRIVSHCHSLCT